MSMGGEILPAQNRKNMSGKDVLENISRGQRVSANLTAEALEIPSIR